MTLGPSGQEKLALAAMTLSAAIWGSGFIVTRVAIDAGFGTGWILFGRFMVTTVFFALLFLRDLLRMTRRAFGAGLLAGILLFFGFMFQTFGLARTTPARNAFITATYVVIVPLLGWLLTRRRPSGKVFAGALLSLAGIALLSWGAGGEGGSLAGDLLTFLCAVSFAAHFIVLEWAVRRAKASQLLFLQMAVTTVLSSFMLLSHPAGTAALPVAGSADWTRGLLALAYLAVFSSGVAYAIQTIAQKHTASSRAAIVLAAEALWGSLFSVLFRFEPLTWRLAAGGLLIFVSILLASYVRAPEATVQPEK